MKKIYSKSEFPGVNSVVEIKVYIYNYSQGKLHCRSCLKLTIRNQCMECIYSDMLVSKGRFPNIIVWIQRVIYEYLSVKILIKLKQLLEKISYGLFQIDKGISV